MDLHHHLGSYEMRSWVILTFPHWWGNTCLLVLSERACLPAEIMVSQPQFQRIRSPSIVQLALQNWGVPREAVKATLRDGFCASVWLTRRLHTFLILICSNTRREKCQTNEVFNCWHITFTSSLYGRTFRTCGQGTEIPDNLIASIDVTPRRAVIVRVPETGKWREI